MDNFFEVTETRGKGKNKVTVTIRYRRLTPDEMKNLRSGNHVQFITRYNEVKTFKVTSVHTWKTRPDVEVRVKFGLYAYSYARWTPGGYSGEILIIEAYSEYKPFLEVTND